MSAKTKIVVFHLKELIYTGIFVILGILFIILMILMFSPSRSRKSKTPTEQALYVPGVYTTPVALGNMTVAVEMIVDKDCIHSLRLVIIEEDVATMYPLVQPTFEEIASKVLETQSVTGVTYNRDTQYTTKVLVDAIESNINKAVLREDSSAINP